MCRAIASTSPRPNRRRTSALESMTSIALRALFAQYVGNRVDALHRLPTLGAKHDLLERRLAGDRRQLAEYQLGHRHSFADSADLQRLVELVRDVAYLDHFHGSHMIACGKHAIKGRTPRSGARRAVRRQAAAAARGRLAGRHGAQLLAISAPAAASGGGGAARASSRPAPEAASAASQPRAPRPA